MKMKILNFFLVFFVTLTSSLNLYAQEDVTTFLGIPINGSKSEMINKLKEKGFKINQYGQDILTGEFNGTNVNLHIGTNNNKVYRIMVADANTLNESDIKVRFNNLCQQFQNNSKYTFAISNSAFKISESEDISYEMSVKNKRYEAIFYQTSELKPEEIQSYLLSKYSKEKLSNQTEEFKNELMSEINSYLVQKQLNKVVWFMIT